jgi:anti-sigma28 factor (negative regulator of flagellin synthesis)
MKPNQLGDALQPSTATPQPVPVDVSPTSHQSASFHPMAELVERTLELAHIRRVSTVKEKVANGSYKLASSDLAECLLKISDRDFR